MWGAVKCSCLGKIRILEMSKHLRSLLLLFSCGFSGSSWADVEWPEFPIFWSTEGGYYAAITEAQAPVVEYLRSILYDVAYPGSPQYAGALLGGGPVIALDRPAFTDSIGPQPYWSLNGEYHAPNQMRGGVGFTPDCSSNCWDPSAQAWAIPLNATGIVGLELLYKPYVDGVPLSSPPIPGQPLPGLVTTPVGDIHSGIARLPALRVEIQVRTTSRFGQDLRTEFDSDLPWGYDPGLDLGGDFGLISSNIGTWFEYFEKSPGVWGLADDHDNTRQLSHRLNTESLRVFLGANTCNLGRSRLNGEVAFTRGAAMSFTLPTVSISNFDDSPGSVIEGPDSLGGAFFLECYKYDFQNVVMTVSGSDIDGEPSKGVVLSGQAVTERSTNVGVQLLYALGASDQAAPSTSFQELQVGINNLGSNPAGLLESFKNGGYIRMPGSSLVKAANARKGYLAVHFKPRYYKVGNGPAIPGVVQATYTINMDYQ